MEQFIQANQAPFIAKVYKSGEGVSMEEPRALPLQHQFIVTQAHIDFIIKVGAYAPINRVNVPLSMTHVIVKVHVTGTEYS